jgi:hypothetical protein
MTNVVVACGMAGRSTDWVSSGSHAWSRSTSARIAGPVSRRGLRVGLAKTQPPAGAANAPAAP